MEVIDLGLMDYEAAWARQREIHRGVVEERGSDTILVVEHPPVLTLGRHADPRFVLGDPEQFRARGVSVVRIDRGGEVTAHVPGQIVVYPILRLSRFKLGPRTYVELLQQVMIDCLAHFDIQGASDPKWPGVWIGRAKVGAVGVRIADRVSLHGIALNVNNSLELFDRIVPCGITGDQGRSVTTLAAATGRALTTSDVRPVIVGILMKALEKTRATPPAP